MAKNIYKVLCLLTLTSLICGQQMAEQEIIKKMLTGYDNRVKPMNRNNASEPAQVTVNMYVRSFDAIDDCKMEYTVQLTYREQWNDLRLSYSRHHPPAWMDYITMKDTSQIWTPDTFFSNEKHGHLHNIIYPNAFVRIRPNGDVLFSIRVSLTLGCPMNLRKYPFDKQTCGIRLASYGYTNRDVQFAWKEEDPVQIIPDAGVGVFLYKGLETNVCDSATNTGVYSCLRVDFQFARKWNHYLLYVYIPTSMMVILSWLSFWLDHKAVTARALIGLSTLLVMATNVANYNQTVPKVSYTKAMDVWTGICHTFAFVALLEFIVVNYLSRCGNCGSESPNGNRQSSKSSNLEVEIPLNNIPSEQDAEPNADTTPNKTSTLKGLSRNYMARFKTLSERIDGASRVIFPLAFALFIIIYWIAY